MKNKTGLLLGIIGIGLVFAFVLIFSPETPEYRYEEQPKAFKGLPNAYVDVVEYANYQCGYCAAFAPEAMRIVEKYSDVIRFEFRHFPFINQNPQYQLISEAAECANDQGKFWEYHEHLYAHMDAVNPQYAKTAAERVGLDMKQFSNCMESRAKADNVAADILEAQRNNVDRTPTFFVNGKKVSDYRSLEDVIVAEIDAVLKPDNGEIVSEASNSEAIE